MEKPNFNQITLCVLIILLAIAIILLASINSKMQRAHQKYLTSQQLTEGIDSALGSSKLIRIMTEDVDNIKREDEIFLPLWEEDYKLCCPKDHPLTKFNSVKPADLHKFDFLECPSCEAHQQTIGLVACEGLHLNIIASGENKCQVMYLVEAGIGVSFLPTGVLEMSSNLTTVNFEGPRMFRRIGICYPANKTLQPVVSKVIKVLTEKTIT